MDKWKQLYRDVDAIRRQAKLMEIEMPSCSSFYAGIVEACNTILEKSWSYYREHTPPVYYPNSSDSDKRPAVRVEVWCSKCHAGLCDMTHSTVNDGRPAFMVDPHDCEGRAAKLEQLLMRCVKHIGEKVVDNPESRELIYSIAQSIPDYNGKNGEKK